MSVTGLARYFAAKARSTGELVFVRVALRWRCGMRNNQEKRFCRLCRCHRAVVDDTRQTWHVVLRLEYGHW